MMAILRHPNVSNIPNIDKNLTSGNTTRPRTLPRADKRTSQPGLIQDFYNKLRQACRAPSRAPTETSRADLRATSRHTTLTNRLAHN